MLGEVRCSCQRVTPRALPLKMQRAHAVKLPHLMLCRPLRHRKLESVLLAEGAASAYVLVQADSPAAGCQVSITAMGAKLRVQALATATEQEDTAPMSVPSFVVRLPAVAATRQQAHRWNGHTSNLASSPCKSHS